MADRGLIPICESAALTECGEGVRVTVDRVPPGVVQLELPA